MGTRWRRSCLNGNDTITATSRAFAIPTQRVKHPVLGPSRPYGVFGQVVPGQSSLRNGEAGRPLALVRLQAGLLAQA